MFDPELAPGPDAPQEAERSERPLTVTQVAALIKATLELHSPPVLAVIGQVSNLRRQGHWYFTLKDDASVLGCVAWATSARSFGFEPEEGDEVVATGHLSHYGPQGRTQFYVRELRPVGEGALVRRFRALCEELRRLGYFDEARKKRLPPFPRRIAVITSLASAAVRDVVATAGQRCPAVGLVLVDVRVQGDGAAAQVARAIARVDRDAVRLGIDAILVTRGGGSAEDLWAFNERIVAEAAFRCRLPLVAAIGHESDTTVIELVADRRAATPTQAVMHLVPSAAQLRVQVDHLAGRLRLLVRRLVEAQVQRHASARRDLNRGLTGRTAREELRLERLKARLGRALPPVPEERRALAGRGGRLARAAGVLLARRGDHLAALRGRLEGLDPLRVLARGYSCTMTAGGKVVRSASAVKPGEAILTRVADGSFGSVVVPGAGPAPAHPRTGRSASQMDLFDAPQ